MKAALCVLILGRSWTCSISCETIILSLCCLMTLGFGKDFRKEFNQPAIANQSVTQHAPQRSYHVITIEWRREM